MGAEPCLLAAYVGHYPIDRKSCDPFNLGHSCFLTFTVAKKNAEMLVSIYIESTGNSLTTLETASWSADPGPDRNSQGNIICTLKRSVLEILYAHCVLELFTP